MLAQDAEVPVIDIAGLYNGNLASTVEQIGRACQEAGCFIALHHGVPGQLLHSAQRETQRFFALPDAAKNTLSGGPAPRGCSRGYFLGPDALLRGEGMDIGPESRAKTAFGRCGEPRAPGNHWPSPAQLPDWKLIMQWYYVAMEALSVSMMGAIARYLGVRTDHFAESLRDTAPILRLWHCAAKSHFTPADLAATEPGASDGEPFHASGLTLLYTDRPSRLQTCNARGQWRALPVIEDGIAVVLGNGWRHWSHGSFASATCRLAVDPRDSHVLAFYAPWSKPPSAFPYP
ncbi:MAG: 2-oxoglutarate and iron-dependent oxygenase domain-containing protein [Gammaproteobacteria bacterium]